MCKSLKNHKAFLTSAYHPYSYTLGMKSETPHLKENRAFKYMCKCTFAASLISFCTFYKNSGATAWSTKTLALLEVALLHENCPYKAGIKCYR